MKTNLNSLEASDLPKGKRGSNYDLKLDGDEQQWEKNWEARRKRKWSCEKTLDSEEMCRRKKYKFE